MKFKKYILLLQTNQKIHHMMGLKNLEFSSFDTLTNNLI